MTRPARRATISGTASLVTRKVPVTLTAKALFQVARSVFANGALGASIDAGQALIGEAQAQIETLPSNKYSDALVGFADAFREMLEQFRAWI